jgi:hypothetical protein
MCIGSLPAARVATWTGTRCSGAHSRTRSRRSGEAAARISDRGRARVSDVPWGQIVAMRHVLVHVYWGVDADRLWVTATEDIPLLIQSLEKACFGWPLDPPDA